MTITKTALQPRARISYDEMEAFLTLPTPLPGEEFTMDEIMMFLEVNQILHGIEQEIIKRMIRDKIYEEEVCVAVGTPMVEGVDGWFDYLFNLEVDKKPKIKPDGSVDYWNLNLIESVQQGQVIAVYHPPVESENGITVTGKTIPAKKAKDLPSLKGKGFTKQEDGVTYTANIAGKIDMVEDRVIVSPLYEISGDADLSVGNINFIGDVLIHGSVFSGVTIKTTGKVIVDGVVESADITAGGDIILRGGMVGANKASITAKGDLFAKFIEYTKVNVKGKIETDTLIGCEVVCGDWITLRGKKSKIMGGDIFAVAGVEASVLGSVGEADTIVKVGARDEIIRRSQLLEKKLEVMEQNLSEIEEELSEFDKLEKERNTDYRSDPRRVELLRAKIQDTATIAKDKNELEALRTEIENAKGAVIKVKKEVYPGVSIGIDDLKISVLEEQERVDFIRRLDKIVMVRPE
ncbi:MAG: DUF342 domain-containing protein [Lachnospiraceae bacterium]|nr:DUF342 domain-containing protein [Lachnospiraceae bacterium]